MRVGKTSVAEHLQQKNEFAKAAFSQPIKDFARMVGWDGEKNKPGRELLQDIGTVVRKYDKKFWINKMLSDLPTDTNIVVDDMRMLLEDQELNKHGFKTILVVRDPSHIDDAPQETTGHITEKEVDLIKPWRIITNNGDFHALHAQIDAIVQEYRDLFLRKPNLVKTVKSASNDSDSISLGSSSTPLGTELQSQAAF